MGYTRLPNSGLRKLNPENGSTDWSTHFDWDMTRLNDTLLKVLSLLDVDAIDITTGDTLMWNDAMNKWVKYTPESSPLS